MPPREARVSATGSSLLLHRSPAATTRTPMLALLTSFSVRMPGQGIPQARTEDAKCGNRQMELLVVPPDILRVSLLRMMTAACCCCRAPQLVHAGARDEPAPPSRAISSACCRVIMAPRKTLRAWPQSAPAGTPSAGASGPGGSAMPPERTGPLRDAPTAMAFLAHHGCGHLCAELG